MYWVFREMTEDQSRVDRILDEYAGKLAASSKPQITSRDLEFAREGLNMAVQYLGESIIEPVKQGFIRGYQE